MPPLRRSSATLPDGIYNEVLSRELAAKLATLTRSHATLTDIHKDTDVDEQLVTLVRDAARIALGAQSNATHKLALAQRMLDQLVREGLFRADETQLEAKILSEIAPIVHGNPRPRTLAPRGSLLSSGLITNAPGESVLDHLASEFASADRVDLLCSFIKLSGLDRFRALIERHRAMGRPLRVLTTTYMRATDHKAVLLLHQLGAEVRISFDESHTRLHAKSWIFDRASEYATAYVGSSNLSHTAQTDGLEWNVRVTQADQPDLVAQMASVFETYWQDTDKFEPFDGSEAHTQRLKRALSEPDKSQGFVSFELEPKEWQKPILRELTEARALGRHRNLVVAATGTGKTLIAAFDFERLYRDGHVRSLLFIAHRREILVQARDAFRQVLRLPNFGELWVDGHSPTHFTHVFASVQSLDASKLDPAHYDHVIVDEVHHAAAKSYVAILTALKPRELVGLTATPERTDALSYESIFPRPYVANLRLWDAIPNVLVPFRYFVLDTEGVDLSDAKWSGGYVSADLSQRLVTAADLWIRTVVRALSEHVARIERLRALAFCVDKSHAQVVADRLTRDAGLTARVLTHETSREERDRAKSDLLSGHVQVLCVVDLFNEGVDIPDVNTLFLFRPTESATVFIQQIGRGLRRSRDKDLLTIFDLTGRQHARFRFDQNLRALLGHTPRELKDFVEDNHGRLPSGCSVHFEERSRQEILEQIRRAIPGDTRGLRALMLAHPEASATLAGFLEATGVELYDVYRTKRSWTLLRAEAGLANAPTDALTISALANVHKLLEVDDTLRIYTWKQLALGHPPATERERRLTTMLFAVLYDRFAVAELNAHFARWLADTTLRAELLELIAVLEPRASDLHAPALGPEIPLVVHARYLDVELSAAFNAVTHTDGKIRHFYTGVEPVCDGRYDLLLVTLAKGAKTHEHLRYKDYCVHASAFHWESQAATRQSDPLGQRHLHPERTNVTPLLFVRETKRDPRGVTAAFCFLGPVRPLQARGERPIAITWGLSPPLRPEWVRQWSNVS
ncbi:MAG: DUF3427 domain-containing protein [Deltaproteobacteria bacterium]|nr:DUF3427 domain-containing protein [Deltaproteobacteria bacterium]